MKKIPIHKFKQTFHILPSHMQRGAVHITGLEHNPLEMAEVLDVQELGRLFPLRKNLLVLDSLQIESHVNIRLPSDTPLQSFFMH